jgi:hypothetical protein
MGLLLHCYNHLRASATVLRTGVRERGAVTAEYVGILLVVGALVAALLAAGIPGRISAGVNQALSQLGLPGAAAPECTPTAGKPC